MDSYYMFDKEHAGQWVVVQDGDYGDYSQRAVCPTLLEAIVFVEAARDPSDLAIVYVHKGWGEGKEALDWLRRTLPQP